MKTTPKQLRKLKTILDRLTFRDACHAARLIAGGWRDRDEIDAAGRAGCTLCYRAFAPSALLWQADAAVCPRCEEPSIVPLPRHLRDPRDVLAELDTRAFDETPLAALEAAENEVDEETQAFERWAHARVGLDDVDAIDDADERALRDEEDERAALIEEERPRFVAGKDAA